MKLQHVASARHLRSLALALVALFLVANAPGPAAAQSRATPPYPGALGPRAVGHTKFDIVDASRADRKLELQVWYPIDAAEATGKAAFYKLGFGTLGITSDVAFENRPVALQPNLPLVVFSHGSGGISVQSIGLMETLASHGFVVAAPNHTGNTTLDIFLGTTVPFSVSAVNRPGDVTFVIDEMLRRSADPTSPFYLRIRPTGVGVVGHSFGGFTALATASGFLSVPADPRVTAIVPTAPASSILSDDLLSSIDLPTLVLGGTLDTTTPVIPNSSRPFDLVSGRPLIRVDIVGGTHFHFANICEIGQQLLTNGLDLDFVLDVVTGYSDACLPGACPLDDAQRIQKLYTVAFFRRHLRADVRYERFLNADYAAANEPDVTFARKNAELPWWWAWYLALYSR